MIIRDLLKERVLVLDGAMGTYLQDLPLTAVDFGGADHEGCYEHLNLTRPDVLGEIHDAYLRAGADIICTNTFGGTRIVLSEYGLESRVHAINAAAACASPGKPSRVRTTPGRQAALRRGVAGTPDQDHHGHRRRHVRRGPGRLPGTDPGAAGRRHRPAAHRDGAGHAEPQGHGHGRAAGHERSGARGARDDLGDHRTHGHDAGRAERGGALHVRGALRAPDHRPELRHRPGIHDRPPAQPGRPVVGAGELPPERRPAGRGRALPRDADVACDAAGTLHRQRLAARRRRLLRDHAATHRSAGRHGAEQTAASARGSYGRGRLRPRLPAPRSRQPPGHRGRAHQRDRLETFPRPDRRRGVRARRGRRARPDQGRRPGAGHLPGQSGPRRIRRHAAVPEICRRQGAGAADDRFHGNACRRAGAQELAGKSHRQLHQPGRRGGALRRHRAAAAPLRRRGGGRVHRRGSGAGHGGQPGTQAGDCQARLRAADRRVRIAPHRHYFRPPRVSGRHGGRELHRFRRRDHRRGTGHQGRVPAVQHHPGRLERLFRASESRSRGAERRVSLPLHPCRPGLRHRQLGAPGALRVDPGRGTAAGGGPAVLARRRPHRGVQRVLPRQEVECPAARRDPAAGAPAVDLCDRGEQGRPVRRPGAGAGEARRDGHHQRPADGRDERGGPAVQQQRADRGRGPAQRRGDEGGGGVPGAPTWKRARAA